VIEIPQSFVLTNADTPFADVTLALKEPNGLIAIGGKLTSNRLIDAYRQGIFPWYSEGDPVLWYSPNPRMVITPKTLHIANSLRKTINKKIFEIKINYNFEAVIRHCKTVKRKETGTWIDENMVQAYTKLNQQGVAKSIEVYQNSELVGGLYGLAMGKVFFGESMFSLKPDTSKIALVYLLQSMDYELVDCQVENPHLKSLGAYNIERSTFVKLLKDLL
jgi:leucyl/phenylalanyl-tRNA--protein transferase